MSKRKRKIYIIRTIFYFFSSIIFLFFVTAIILWASGYRYDSQNHTIKATGILAIETQPFNVKVLINDNAVDKQKKTIQIPNLTPQTVKVEIKKDDYQEWYKNLDIKEKQVTWIEKVILVPKKIDQKEIAQNIVAQTLSNKNEKLAYIKNAGEKYSLVEFNLTNNNESAILELDKGVNYELSYSPNDDFILLKKSSASESQYQVIRLSDKQSKIIPNNFSDIIFNTQSNEELYGQIENKIYSFNFSNPENKNLLKENVSVFKVGGKKIYYVTQKENSINLYESNFDGTNESLICEKLPSNKYSILPSQNDDHVALIDNQKNALYLVTKKDKTLKEIDSDVKKAFWNSENKKIIYNNDFEIKAYDLSNAEKKLILRLSHPISEIIEHKDLYHLIFKTEDGIYLIESDGCNKATFTKFDEEAKTSSIYYDNKSNKVIFTKQKDQKNGLYLIDLNFPD